MGGSRMSDFLKVDLKKMSWQDAKLVLNTNRDLRMDIAANMQIYGGSFVKDLADCIYSADTNNTRKLINAFYKYFLQYQPKDWK